MAVEVKMPQMGESITEGTLVKWFKKPGERIVRDEPLFEISTDKVDTEVPSPVDGYLSRILVSEGDTVAVDTLVCVISEEAPAPAPGLAAESTTTVGFEPDGARDGTLEERTAAGESGAPGPADRISPAVRKLIREHSVDMTQIQGTGESGRVTRDDVLAFVARRGGKQASPPDRTTPTAGAVPPGGDRVEPMSVMRRKIAEHMIASQRISAHASTVHDCDMTAVDEARALLRDKLAAEGVRPTYLHFVVHAVARKLAEFPALNASIQEHEVCFRSEINVGVAVSLDQGLLVPVVRKADTLSVADLARTVTRLARQAREKTITPEEVHGGTFTVTNPGVFGTLIGTPIINQPQVAILCVGAVQKRVVVLPETDAIAIRKMAYLSLTFDHRLIDGAGGAMFLSGVSELIENGEFTLE